MNKKVLFFSLLGGCLLGIEPALAQLPQAPVVGGATTGNIFLYFRDIIVWTIRIVVFGLVILGTVRFGGGLLDTLAEARRKGEWGHFAGYAAAGVGVIVALLWFGSQAEDMADAMGGIG